MQRIDKRRSIDSTDAEMHSSRHVPHGLDYIELLITDREPSCFEESQPVPLVFIGPTTFAVGLYRSLQAFRVRC